LRRSLELLYGADTIKTEISTTPLRALGLTLRRTSFPPYLTRLRQELREAGITLKPHFYLTTGYGTVAATANIGLGFYDSNEVLREINHDARGWTYDTRDRRVLLIHEVGHAFCYAHRLYRRPDFRRTFRVKGHFMATYPVSDRYTPNPWSRDYVNLSGDHYAQKHPDEDFAETFTAWMLAKKTWRRVWKRYPGALPKLEYVERIVRQYRRREPVIEMDPTVLEDPLETVKTTVGAFLKADVPGYRRRATGYVDPALRKIFPRRYRRANGVLGADGLLREARRHLVREVSAATGASPVVVGDLVTKLTERAGAMGLQAAEKERTEKLVRVSAYCALLAHSFKRHGVFLTKSSRR
jgi:hypothetical protein